jgi:MiaB/RimO family radical SAM methylthiotransferase
MNNATTKNIKFHIETWGCQMNYADSAKIRFLLQGLGLQECEDENEADVIILNTCSVRQRAEDKVLGLGRKFRDLKSDDPQTVLILTGCMGQRICRDGKTGSVSKEDLWQKGNSVPKKETGGKDGNSYKNNTKLVDSIQKNNLGNNCRLEQGSDNKPHANKGFVSKSSYKQLDHDDPKYDLKYLRKLQRQMDWVDYFVNIGDLKKIEKIIVRTFCQQKRLQNKCQSIRIPKTKPRKTLTSGAICKSDYEYMNFRQHRRSKIHAYVPISKGCDNFCTYCIVPFTRGREKSRRLQSIKREVRHLVNKQYKLITLLGQNVNSWHVRHDGRNRRFPYLLQEISAIEEEFWLTFLTSHPKDFSKQLVDTMADLEKICQYLNLPVQSGSNKILKKMNRNYTREEYIKKVEYLRKKIPDIKLSTDIIVGFPGETKEDFAQTTDLVKQLQFSMVYVSDYSPREGAVSAHMDDDVTLPEKKRRKKIVNEIVSNFKKDFNEKLINKEVDVLVLNNKKGKTFDLRDVILEGEGWVKGQIMQGRVLDGNAKGLKVKRLTH